MEIKITDELLKTFPPEAASIIRALLAKIDRLEAKIVELESKLNQTPQNSSRPPSTQHPHAKPAPAKPKSKRKRGGQSGHMKFERPQLPSDKCNEVVTRKPTCCRDCKGILSGEDAEPIRHQVWELPEIKPHVTEYQLHRLLCKGCGKTTCASLPAGVPTGQTGPRLTAMVGLLMGCFRQSKARTALFLEQFLGQPCCPSLTVKLQNHVAAAVAPAYQELVDELPSEKNLLIDESPTKQENTKAWLWAMLAAHFTVFTIRLTRAATVLDEFLGEKFNGIVNCDRAKMYWQCQRLQWCWAHLRRDFQKWIDSPNHQAKRLGHDLMRQTNLLFAVWKEYCSDAITWETFQAKMKPIQTQIDALLLRGAGSGNRIVNGSCRELYHHRDWLWTFTQHQGVEPTNNASERALRHGVIWRKLSFGTQSEAGSRFVASMLTVIETCRQQERNCFQYLTDAVAAYYAKQPCPSLLPAK